MSRYGVIGKRVAILAAFGVSTVTLGYVVPVVKAACVRDCDTHSTTILASGQCFQHKPYICFNTFWTSGSPGGNCDDEGIAQVFLERMVLLASVGKMQKEIGELKRSKKAAFVEMRNIRKMISGDAEKDRLMEKINALIVPLLEKRR